MAQSPLVPNLARKIGSSRSNMSAACRRARRTSSCWAVGRIWKTADRFSSAASFSVIVRKYRSARFRGAVARWDSMTTRNNTSSALGGGKSSGGKLNSGMSANARSPRERLINDYTQRVVVNSDHLWLPPEMGGKAAGFIALSLVFAVYLFWFWSRAFAWLGALIHG